MTTPKTKTAHVSFHQWLALQSHTNYAPLAAVWEPCRGRMTEASVDRRAVLTYGLLNGIGAAAFRAYKHAISHNNP